MDLRNLGQIGVLGLIAALAAGLILKEQHKKKKPRDPLAAYTPEAVGMRAEDYTAVFEEEA